MRQYSKWPTLAPLFFHLDCKEVLKKTDPVTNTGPEIEPQIFNKVLSSYQAEYLCFG